MTPAIRQARDVRRADLCSRMQAQRLVIAQQLGNEVAGPSGYPRSRVMRLLTGHPDLLMTVLGGLANLFRRRRSAKSAMP